MVSTQQCCVEDMTVCMSKTLACAHVRQAYMWIEYSSHACIPACNYRLCSSRLRTLYRKAMHREAHLQKTLRRALNVCTLTLPSKHLSSKLCSSAAFCTRLLLLAACTLPRAVAILLYIYTCYRNYKLHRSTPCTPHSMHAGRQQRTMPASVLSSKVCCKVAPSGSCPRPAMRTLK